VDQNSRAPAQLCSKATVALAINEENAMPRFTFKQGGELFLIIVGVGLLVVLVMGSTLIPPKKQAASEAPAAMYVIVSTQTSTPQTSLPPSVTTAEMPNGHWAELCQGQSCIRARWMANVGMFQLLDGTWIDPAGYTIYPMALETDLIDGAKYSVCDMPNWNTIWWHHKDDVHTTQLTDCMVLTYDGPDGIYQKFTQEDGIEIWFNQVGFNSYPYVSPMDTSR
jgi:hypothetical protein